MRTPFHSNLVWPPPVLVWLFVISYGLVAASLWLMELSLHGADATDSDTEEVVRIRMAILAGAAAMYALFRIGRFHPLCNPAYAAWLKLSPWTAGRPLPFGPVHPVWQDGVVIGVLTVIAVWHAHLSPILPMAVFGLVYLAGMTALLVFARRWWSSLVLGFLWPALILPGAEGWPMVFLIAAIAVVVWHGHRQCLKAFPWNFLKNTSCATGPVLQTEIRINGRSATDMQFNLGWPFMALSPKVQPGSVSQLASICLSALFGWWSFCLIERIKPDPLPELIVIFAFVAAVIRWAVYASGITPPFNLWGRIAWGKIVVPGFDKILLTPAAAVGVAILGGMFIRHAGSWFPVTESCVFALVWYVLFAGGPTLRSWVLTGHHGFRPPVGVNANKQLMKPV